MSPAKCAVRPDRYVNKGIHAGKGSAIFLFLLFALLVACMGCIGNPFSDQTILRHEMMEESYQGQIYKDQLDEQRRQDAQEAPQREERYHEDR